MGASVCAEVPTAGPVVVQWLTGVAHHYSSLSTETPCDYVRPSILNNCVYPSDEVTPGRQSHGATPVAAAVCAMSVVGYGIVLYVACPLPGW
jgi:hypothetical protein